MAVNPLPIIITLVGAYMLVKLGFFFILHPHRVGRELLRALKNRSLRRNLFLALAGTLGVGNVLGVCVGISVGGAGSVFWMLVSVPFAAVLKYSEVALSSDCRIKSRSEDGGGMAAVMRQTLGKGGVTLSLLYAACVLLLGLVMGAALQSAAVRSVTGEIFDTPPVVLGFLFTVLIVLSVMRGEKIIEKITSIAIPVTTIIYILVTVAIVTVNLEGLGSVIQEIFLDAVTPKAASGGLLGFLTTGAVREGFSRGLLSNEAGAGTSSMALAREEGEPRVLGLLGIVEVFFDTFLLCTLTALAVLSVYHGGASMPFGLELILDAASLSLGSVFSLIIRLCVVLFAYSTVICWYYYSTEALYFLSGKKSAILFTPLYAAFVLLGFLFESSAFILLTDALMLILTCLSCLTVIKSSDRVRKLSEPYMNIKIVRRN